MLDELQNVELISRGDLQEDNSNASFERTRILCSKHRGLGNSSRTIPHQSARTKRTQAMGRIYRPTEGLELFQALQWSPGPVSSPVLESSPVPGSFPGLELSPVLELSPLGKGVVLEL